MIAPAAAAMLAVVALDAGATAVALPHLRLTLGSSNSGLVWIQVAWLLGLALVAAPGVAWLARGGRRRPLALAGLLALTAGAAVCAVAQDTAVVVGGAALAGTGAGAVLAGLPVVSLGGWAALPAAALVAGPLAAGGLTEAQNWRWVFAAEAAASTAALVVVAANLRGQQRAAEPVAAPRASAGRLGIQSAGLALAALGLVQAEVWGWGSLATILVLAAALGALALAPAFRNRAVAGVGLLAVTGTLLTFLLLMPEYLALSRGLSPLRVGLVTVAVTGPAAALGALAFRWAGPAREPAMAVAGLVLAALAALAFARLDAGSSYWAILPALGLLGSGLGLAAAGFRPRLEQIDALLVPVAAGCLLLLAGAGSLFQHSQTRERGDGASFEQALAEGIAVSVWLPTAILAAAALVTWRAAATPGGSRAHPAGAMTQPPHRPA